MFNINKTSPLVGALGLPDFNGAYQLMCQNWVKSDYNFAFIIPRRSTPRVRVSTITTGDHDSAVARSHRMYFGGPFKSDDGIRHSGTVIQPHIRILNTRRDPLDDFQKEFYRIANISYLVTLSARLGDSICYIGFLRSGGRMFSDSEIDEICGSRQLMLPLVKRHDQLLLLKEACTTFASAEAGTLNHISHRSSNISLIRALFNEGSDLSEREAEVCARAMLGYSIEATALEMEISTSTVGTFRRRAFEKLGIASGGELFAAYRRCLDHLHKSVTGF